MMQTDLLISQDQNEFLSKSIKGEKGKGNHDLKGIKSNDASSRPKANFLSFLDGIANEENLPHIENITLSRTNRSETINKEAELTALEYLSNEIKPDIKEKLEEESLADCLESSTGMNERPDDEAVDKDLLLRFGSGLHTGKEGIENTTSAENLIVSSHDKANGNLQLIDSAGEEELEPAAPILDQGPEKAAMVSDEAFGKKGNMLKTGSAALQEGEGKTGKGVAASTESSNMPSKFKSTGNPENSDQAGEEELEPAAPILDQDPEKAAMVSDEVFGKRGEVLESGLSESKSKSFFDAKKGENVDLNKRDLLFKLNSTTQEATNNLSKNFVNQESSPNQGGNPQNNKPVSTKIQISDSDIFRNKIDKIESDNGADDDPFFLNSQSSDRVSEAILNTKETNSLQKPLQTDVLSQIVKKAALNLKNGQTQVRIEIKPEYLGHIRMRISTENHQVTAEIMAETPLVKEIIENNIHQLKTELQNHGLEMDKFDVDVFGSHDSDQNGGEYERPSFLKKAGETAEDRVESGLPEEKEGPIQVAEERQGTNVIDFFA